MIDGAFDRLAKWWRNAVDRFELQSHEKILGPKIDFPKFAFLTVKFFCAKKVTNIQIVTHPYSVRLSKNVLDVFHAEIVNLARGRKCMFKIGHFLALWPLHTPGRAQKCCRTQKYSMGLLFLSALPLNAQLVVLLQRLAKTAWYAFPQKVAFLARFEFTPLPVVNGGKKIYKEDYCAWTAVQM